MKTVYIAISADVLHHGHINLIKKASEYGNLIVGVLTDEVVATYKRFPILDYEQRTFIIKNINGVSEVVPQDTLDYTTNLKKYTPDYVFHGDDWKEGVQSKIRQNVIDTLSQWGGELIEIPYTEDVTIDQINNIIKNAGSVPESRRGKLKKLISLNVKDEKINSFDAIWISSLTDSTAKGKPDIELVDMTSRINTINEIMEVSSKPIILDGDTGGLIEHFVFNIKTIERMGVSAIIIEDKIGLKKNSLFGTEVEQTQDSIENFCEKIKAGKKALITNEFMIIARIESLILKQGMDDAINRAKAYIEAGADGIMIHSREKEPDEIFEFCEKFNEFAPNVPLVVVPTSFNQVYEEEFAKKGVNIVIYANHLIRSAYPSMMETATTILENERCKEVDDNCLPIKEILTLIPDE